MNSLKHKKKFWLAAQVLFALLLCAEGIAQHEGHEHSVPAKEPAGVESLSMPKAQELWTCSMHPHIQLSKPGKCPICGMNLIPVRQDTESGAQEAGLVVLKLSKSAERLAQVQIAPVERRAVTNEVRMVGNVDYDETRLNHITAWVPGRIDRMFVDYTGVAVKKGDHMVELYSPELLSSQEEVIQAARAAKRLKNTGSALVNTSTQRTLTAAREKLVLLGLTEQQVNQIEQRGKAQDRITIYAPTGGVVVERNATEGMYVKTGTKIYSIADLSHLWVHLDAYESDLPWIRYGQEVEFFTQALPGTAFKGKISFIAPFLDPQTRTSKVRVNIENEDGKLKPGMFITGAVKANIFAEGKVIDTSLKGKYLGPMHPEIVRDEPGECPICGMDLVSAQELGYVTEKDDVLLPLVIPATAPLITGKRAVVYVKHPDASEYEPRDVVLGPRAGAFYIIKQGLLEGELVVTNGAFKIDADLQIQGKKSMMTPAGGKKMQGHAGHEM